MTLEMVQSGEWFTIFAMAIALGMDAFSLGLGIGLRGIRFLHIIKISAIVALFHISMPLIGMFTGQYASLMLGDVALITGGILLVLLGSHMIYSAVWGEEVEPFDHSTFFGLIVFALSVSIDSFSVGISLGLFSSDVLLTVLTFGLMGGVMCVAGLFLGSKVSYGLGGYGEAIGGAILLAFGLKFLL